MPGSNSILTERSPSASDSNLDDNSTGTSPSTSGISDRRDAAHGPSGKHGRALGQQGYSVGRLLLLWGRASDGGVVRRDGIGEICLRALDSHGIGEICLGALDSHGIGEICLGALDGRSVGLGLHSFAGLRVPATIGASRCCQRYRHRNRLPRRPSVHGAPKWPEVPRSTPAPDET